MNSFFKTSIAAVLATVVLLVPGVAMANTPVQGLQFTTDVPEYINSKDQTFTVQVAEYNTPSDEVAKNNLTFFPVEQNESCITEFPGPMGSKMLAANLPNKDNQNKALINQSLNQDVQLKVADYLNKKVCVVSHRHKVEWGKWGSSYPIYAESANIVAFEPHTLKFEKDVPQDPILTDTFSVLVKVTGAEDSVTVYPSIDNECTLEGSQIDAQTGLAGQEIILDTAKYKDKYVCVLSLGETQSNGTIESSSQIVRSAHPVTVPANTDNAQNSDSQNSDSQNSDSQNTNTSATTATKSGWFGGWSNASPAVTPAPIISLALVNTDTAILGDEQTRTPTDVIFPSFNKKCEQSVKDLTDSRLMAYYNDINVIDQSNLNRSLTRAEFLKLVLNAAKVDVTKESAPTYTDVPATHTLANYIAYATRIGLVSGDNNTFRPDDTITRAEAAKIFVKAAGINLSSDVRTFSDVEKNHSLAVHIQTAFDNCLLNGRKTMGGETLLANGVRVYEPESYITLAETAKVLYNSAFLKSN